MIACSRRSRDNCACRCSHRCLALNDPVPSNDGIGLLISLSHSSNEVIGAEAHCCYWCGHGQRPFNLFMVSTSFASSSARSRRSNPRATASTARISRCGPIGIVVATGAGAGAGAAAPSFAASHSASGRSVPTGLAFFRNSLLASSIVALRDNVRGRSDERAVTYARSNHMARSTSALVAAPVQASAAPLAVPPVAQSASLGLQLCSCSLSSIASRGQRHQVQIHAAGLASERVGGCRGQLCRVASVSP
jgi:hypothetical protein